MNYEEWQNFTREMNFNRSSLARYIVDKIARIEFLRGSADRMADFVSRDRLRAALIPCFNHLDKVLGLEETTPEEIKEIEKIYIKINKKGAPHEDT